MTKKYGENKIKKNPFERERERERERFSNMIIQLIATYSRMATR